MPNLVSALELLQSAMLKLITLQLIDGSVIRICDRYNVTYLGVEYKYLNFEISDLSETTSGEAIRPNLKIINPNGLFTKLALSDTLEAGILDLIRIPENEVVSGNIQTVFSDRWKIYNVSDINQSLTLQLRRLNDFRTDNIPPRKYSPPDFPTTNLE